MKRKYNNLHTNMGLFQFLASFVIRKKVMKNLRANCPSGIQAEMDTLLADKKSSALILQFMTSTMKSHTKPKAEAIMALPFPPAISQLLADTPKLTTYLLLAARMVGKK